MDEKKLRKLAFLVVYDPVSDVVLSDCLELRQLLVPTYQVIDSFQG